MNFNVGRKDLTTKEWEDFSKIFKIRGGFGAKIFVLDVWNIKDLSFKYGDNGESEVRALIGDKIVDELFEDKIGIAVITGEADEVQ